jgi:hypothetical protein
MREYTEVLNGVVCLSEIKYIGFVEYEYTTADGKNNHKIVVKFKDNERLDLCSDDFELAKRDYDNLTDSLLIYQKAGD